MFEIRTVSLVHINRFVFLALALGIARGLLPGPAAANTLAAWVELVGSDMEASRVVGRMRVATDADALIGAITSQCSRLAMSLADYRDPR
jgi:hypothetical protein